MADELVGEVETTEDELSVRLMDGRTISVPLVCYPRLQHVTVEQRKTGKSAAAVTAFTGKILTKI